MVLHSSTHDVPTKDFQLPETHAVIFAWDPPDFGIPDTVWENLKMELRKQLFQMVSTKGKQHVSLTSQSSPTSGSQPSYSPTGTSQKGNEHPDLLYERHIAAHSQS